MNGSAPTVCVLGGSGFVGRALCAELARRGWAVRVATNDPGRARHLQVIPSLELVAADCHDDRTLVRLFEGASAVVNLVASLHEAGRHKFERVHVDLPQRVASACRASGVGRILHMSALGAAEGAPSRYLHTRGRGEAGIRAASENLALTILRPAVIFGAHDRFLNLFAKLVDAFPILPVAAAEARLAPIWVEDVARAAAVALERASTHSQSYDLCGPRAYALGELVAYVAQLRGRKRRVLALPPWAGQLQASMLGALPGRLLTRDNLRSLSADGTCTGAFPEVFGFQPAALEAIAPGYLSRAAVTDRHEFHRYRAGR